MRQYTDVHEQSGGLVTFSRDGRLVAAAAAYRLLVREVDTLQIVQIYSCTSVYCSMLMSWSSAIAGYSQRRSFARLECGHCVVARDDTSARGRGVRDCELHDQARRWWSTLSTSLFSDREARTARMSDGGVVGSDGGVVQCVTEVSLGAALLVALPTEVQGRIRRGPCGGH